MSGSHQQDDMQSARELRRMAQIYRSRGSGDKADELMDLVSRIEARVKHENLVEMNAFRVEEEVEPETDERASDRQR